MKNNASKEKSRRNRRDGGEKSSGNGRERVPVKSTQSRNEKEGGQMESVSGEYEC
jgi:hypothetical protein